MDKTRLLDNIIKDDLPTILSGQETVDSILHKYPKSANDVRGELEAAVWLAGANRALEPRQGFISSSGKYLSHRIESLPHLNLWQRLTHQYSPQRWVFNLIAPVLIIALIIFVTNSIILTARLSIPGDPFYSAKLSLEKIQLAFTFNPVEKTELSVQFSRERTTEFMELVLDGDYEYLPAAAARMETEIVASLHTLNDLSAMDPSVEVQMGMKLRETLSNEIYMLDMLRASSPASARSEIDLAIRVAQSGVMALR